MRRRTLLGLFPLGGGALLWRQLTSLWRPVANNHVAQTITAVADVMFPGDGLPSASALGLPDRVLDVFSAVPELQTLVAKGVNFLDARAAVQGALNFIALDDAHRLAVVDAAFASGDGELQQFVLALRFHLGTAYYTEPTIKAAFRYAGPPQPNGFADFQDRPL